MPEVMAVVINWKRPENVEKILNALRNQSVPCLLCLVDCHPEPQFAVDLSCLQTDVRVIRLYENLGPPSRFLAGLAYHDTPYVYFHDDDALPGPNCLENYLEWAKKISNQFAVLGCNGRIFKLNDEKRNAHYSNRRIRNRGMEPRQVDTTVRFHFVRSDWLWHLWRFRSLLLQKFPESTAMLLEDDLLLNLGIQQGMNVPTLLVPTPQTEQSSFWIELEKPHAHSSRTEHYQERSRFLQCALEVGWSRTVKLDGTT